MSGQNGLVRFNRPDIYNIQVMGHLSRVEMISLLCDRLYLFYTSNAGFAMGRLPTLTESNFRVAKPMVVPRNITENLLKDFGT